MKGITPLYIDIPNRIKMYRDLINHGIALIFLWVKFTLPPLKFQGFFNLNPNV
jgi:hypothetical protein